MNDKAPAKNCMIHFERRVRERIGPDVDAKTLADGLSWAIANNRSDLVRFVARINLEVGI